MSEPPELVVIETEAEYEAALDSTLAALGLTVAGLQAQAAARDFESPAAFMAWQAVKHRVER